MSLLMNFYNDDLNLLKNTLHMRDYVDSQKTVYERN